MPACSRRHWRGAEIGLPPETRSEAAVPRPWALDDRLSPRALELRRFLERFVSDHRDEPLAWVNVPFFTALQVAVHAERIHPIPYLPTTRQRLAERRYGRRLALRLAHGASPQNARHYLAGDVLFEADGTNHLRALEPIMRRFGEPRPVSGEVRPDRARARRLTRRALRLADRLLRAAEQEGLWLHSDPLHLLRRFAGGARYLAYSEALLAALEPRAVVIASTVNVPPRSLALAAREARVRSVFVPHAPLTTDLAYVELLTDQAAVRGPREADCYADLAGSRERIEVIGNPGLPSDEAPEHDRRLPPVLAPPLDPEQLRAVVELVTGAGVRSLLVAPHPRADRAALDAAIPDGWDVWEGRSYDALLPGPPMLIHYSSGLALEALLLGIPIIDVRWPANMPTAYAFIREPFADVATSSAELRAAIADAYEDVASDERRRELRDWGRQWCSSTGDAAAERGERVVRAAAAADGPLSPVWTAWSPPVTTS